VEGETSFALLLEIDAYKAKVAALEAADRMAMEHVNTELKVLQPQVFR